MGRKHTRCPEPGRPGSEGTTGEEDEVREGEVSWSERDQECEEGQVQPEETRQREGARNQCEVSPRIGCDQW